MSVAIVFIDDGRPEYLYQSIASVNEHLTCSNQAFKILVNDSGDLDYAAELAGRYPEMQQVHHETRRGLAGAVRSAWDAALANGADFIWHHEDDFLLNQSVDVDVMQEILETSPMLAQVSLKRQAVNDQEVAAGGFMETNLAAFSDRGSYVEHRTLFTFNPCLVPSNVARLCLAEPSDGLERGFTDTLLAANYSFGVLGTIQDPPRVHHIGLHRSKGWQA